MLNFKEVVLSKVDIDYKDIFVRSKSTSNIVGGIKLEANTSGNEFYSHSCSSLTYVNLVSLIYTLSDTYKFYDCKTNQEITVDSFNTDTISIDDIDYTKGVIIIRSGYIYRRYTSTPDGFYADGTYSSKALITETITQHLNAGYKVYQLV